MGKYEIIQETDEIPFWDILRKVGKIIPQWENFPVFRKTKSRILGKNGNIVDKISEQVCPFLGKFGKKQENMGLFWENSGLFFPQKIAIFNCEQDFLFQNMLHLKPNLYNIAKNKT